MADPMLGRTGRETRRPQVVCSGVLGTLHEEDEDEQEELQPAKSETRRVSATISKAESTSCLLKSKLLECQ